MHRVQNRKNILKMSYSLIARLALLQHLGVYVHIVMWIAIVDNALIFLLLQGFGKLKVLCPDMLDNTCVPVRNIATPGPFAVVRLETKVPSLVRLEMAFHCECLATTVYVACAGSVD